MTALKPVLWVQIRTSIDFGRLDPDPQGNADPAVKFQKTLSPKPRIRIRIDLKCWIRIPQ